MKKRFPTILTAALCAWTVAAAEPDKALAPGGLASVDIFKYTRESAAQSAQKSGENLMPRSHAFWRFSFGANQAVPGGWNADWAAKESEMRKLVRSSVNRAQKPGEKNTYILETPVSINRFRTDRGQPIMHHHMMPIQNLEVRGGTNYDFVYPLRGELGPSGADRFIVTVDFYGEDGKKCARSEYHVAKPTPGWQDRKVSFRTPDNCTAIRLHFGVQNIGRAEFGSGVLTENKNITGYEVLLFPMGVLDNIAAVAAGQVNFIGFAQRVSDGRIPDDPRMELTLPAGFTVLDGAPWNKVLSGKRNPDGSVTTVVAVRNYHWEKYAVKDFSAIFPVQLAITSDLSPSDKLYPFTYRAVAKDYASPVRTAMLKVIPAIKGEQPRYFKAGVYDARGTLASKEVFDRFAGQYREMGFNAFFNFDCASYVTDAMRREGIESYGTSSNIANGYATPVKPENRPAYTHFIGVDGKPVSDYNGRYQLLCPTTVIYRTEFYRKTILDEVRRKLKDRDYLMSNWEPGHAQTGAGCFCDNCKKDFIAYTKLAEAEVNAVWPRGVIGKYRNEWLDFKSRQHALYLSTYNADIDAIAKELGKSGAGFMPMITRDLMLDSEFNLTDQNAFAVRFYADKVRWINPWGPYLAHHWRNLERDLPGSRIRMLTMARSAVRFLDKVIPAGGARPNLLAFPNGLCVGMVVSPEQLAMDTLSIYVGGWQGSMPYYFPCNYDARYWAALAGCNTAIARTEEFVMKGKALPGVKTELLTDFPAPLYAEINEPAKPISSLQAAAFEKEGKVCVALGNFWEYGEAFFRLSVPGLAADRRYQVRDVMTGTVFADDKGENFTGKALAKGVLQHAGALRWVFLMLEPSDTVKAPAGALTEAGVSAAMERRKGSIAKAAEAERKFVAANAAPVETPSDCSAFQPLSNRGVTVTLDKIKPAKKTVTRAGAYDTAAAGTANAERSVFTVKGGSSVWKVEADRGAMIAGWLCNGRELSFGREMLGLAVDGPWIPAARFVRPFRFVKAEKTADGVALEFTRTLNVNDHKSLDRIVVDKRMEFAPDKVRIVTTLRNPYSDTVRFAYRIQNLPGPMQNRADQTPGVAKFTTEKGVAEFRRSNKNYYFRKKGAPVEKAVLNTLFGSRYTENTGGPIMEITRSEAEFVTSDGKTGLKVTMAPEVDFNGFACWDAPTEITFEPIFNTCELPVGQSRRFEMTMEARQY